MICAQTTFSGRLMAAEIFYPGAGYEPRSGSDVSQFARKTASSNSRIVTPCMPTRAIINCVECF